MAATAARPPAAPPTMAPIGVGLAPPELPDEDDEGGLVTGVEDEDISWSLIIAKSNARALVPLVYTYLSFALYWLSRRATSTVWLPEGNSWMSNNEKLCRYHCGSGNVRIAGSNESTVTLTLMAAKFTWTT